MTDKLKANIKVKNIAHYVETMRSVLNRWAEAKKVKTDDLIVSITIEKPFRPRTTGYKSQNHALNWIIQVICQETGQDFQTTKEYIKSKAVEMGYPMLTRKKVGEGGVTEEVVTDWYGNPRGISEADSSVSECSILIDSAMMLASELGIEITFDS